MERDNLRLIIGICIVISIVNGIYLFSIIWFYGDLIVYVNAERESFNEENFLVSIIIGIVFYGITIAILLIAGLKRGKT